MTSYERMKAFLERKPIDRIPAADGFWGNTLERWEAEGHIKKDEDMVTHFDYDLRGFGGLNMFIDPEFEPVVVEENEDTVLKLDGNGALLRWHKRNNTTPEHVDFTIKEPDVWEEKARPFLKAERGRIDFKGYREARQKSAEEQRFFFFGPGAVFDDMSRVCGHENVLMGMVTDPDWVSLMAETYADMMIDMMEILFAEEGWPDAISYCDDLGYKDRPFMSPEMFRELIMPAAKRVCDYSHDHGRPVLMHSCGGVMRLVPSLIEMGVNVLNPLEAKAGMDILELNRQYGDRLSFMGGIDNRVLCTNDRALIEEELLKKIPPVMANGAFIMHSDHSIPPQVDYETYKWTLQRAREIGTYR